MPPLSTSDCPFPSKPAATETSFFPFQTFSPDLSPTPSLCLLSSPLLNQKSLRAPSLPLFRSLAPNLPARIALLDLSDFPFTFLYNVHSILFCLIRNYVTSE